MGTSSTFLVHDPRSGKVECLHTPNRTGKKSRERRDDLRNGKSLDCFHSTMRKRNQKKRWKITTRKIVKRNKIVERTKWEITDEVMYNKKTKEGFVKLKRKTKEIVKEITRKGK